MNKKNQVLANDSDPLYIIAIIELLFVELLGTIKRDLPADVSEGPSVFFYRNGIFTRRPTITYSHNYCLLVVTRSLERKIVALGLSMRSLFLMREIINLSS